jgi:hypothetical protein
MIVQALAFIAAIVTAIALVEHSHYRQTPEEDQDDP